LKAAAQRGGALGTIVLLVVIAFVGYWVWNHVLFSDEPRSCKAALNACSTSCRKTTSEVPEYQACMKKCQQQAEACEAR
jgi:hypothetical protein